jgi:hypothetical protein
VSTFSTCSSAMFCSPRITRITFANMARFNDRT